MKWLKAWIRLQLIAFLDLPQTYISVDANFSESAIIVMRVRRGEIDVIAERSGKYESYKRILNDVEALARKYNVQRENVVIDAPRDFYR